MLVNSLLNVGGNGFMKNQELSFCTLCGPLEDAMEMMDSGNMAGARAVIKRISCAAQNFAIKKRQRMRPY